MWKWLADHKFPIVASIRHFLCESMTTMRCYHFIEPRKITLPSKHGSYFPNSEECKIVKMIQCCHCGRIKDYNEWNDKHRLADKPNIYTAYPPFP